MLGAHCLELASSFCRFDRMNGGRGLAAGFKGKLEGQPKPIVCVLCFFCGGFPLKKYTHLYVPWSTELVPLLVGRDGAQTPWILDIWFLVKTMIQGISTVAHEARDASAGDRYATRADFAQRQPDYFPRATNHLL